MSRKKWFWIVVVGLNLVPLAASGAPAKTPAPRPSAAPSPVAPRPQAADPVVTPASPTVQRSLTYTEAKSAFLGFRVEKTGSDPDSTVTLRGYVLSECLPGLSISHQKSADGGTIGFEISDPNGVARKCMSDHAGYQCESGDRACVSLSTRPGATIRLKDETDRTKTAAIKVGFCSLPANRDGGNPAECVSLDESLTYQTQSSIDLEARATADQERRDRIARYQYQLSNCADSIDHLPLARQAIAGLRRMGEMTTAQAETEKKRLDRREFDLLAARVQRARTSDELQTAREDIANFAATHPGNDARCAELYHRVALAYVHQRNAGPGAFDDAAATVTEAQQLGGLSDGDNQILIGYQRDISIGRVSSMAQNMNQGNAVLFYPSYVSLMQQLQNDTMEACNGPNANLEACSASMNAIRSASQIPQAAQQRQARDQQMQQQIYQAMMGGQQQGPTGMPGQPMPYGGGGMPQMGGMPGQMPYGGGMPPMGGMPGQMPYGQMPYGGGGMPGQMPYGGFTAGLTGGSPYGGMALNPYSSPMGGGQGGRFF